MSERFTVTYWVAAEQLADAQARASEIAVEQTVEIPRDIVPSGYVEDVILGQVVRIDPCFEPRGGYFADISYADDDVAADFVQLLNVVFGNSSIKPGIRVEDMRLSRHLRELCPGPRFGVEGLRKLAGVPRGPLMMSAIKPVGLSVPELAELAHGFALGGMDVVKDDHGLASQPTSPFADRVEACVEAVARANRITGGKSRYAPNITGPARAVLGRAYLSQELGAGAVMLAPALVGYDTVRALAEDPNFRLPIIAHPSFAGANVITPTTGFSHRFFFGLLHRMMGVDAVIYPNFGGRFGFSREECVSIAEGCAESFGDLKPAIPTPGGGMTLERLPTMQETYGDEVMYLVGGALLREKQDLPAATRRFAQLIGR